MELEHQAQRLREYTNFAIRGAKKAEKSEHPEKFFLEEVGICSKNIDKELFRYRNKRRFWIRFLPLIFLGSFFLPDALKTLKFMGSVLFLISFFVCHFFSRSLNGTTIVAQIPPSSEVQRKLLLCSAGGMLSHFTVLALPKLLQDLGIRLEHTELQLVFSENSIGIVKFFRKHKELRAEERLDIILQEERLESVEEQLRQIFDLTFSGQK